MTKANKENLPALSELHYEVEKAFKNDKLNLLLNQTPPVNWVKKHPFAKGVEYIPIEKVEFMLTRIFQEWRVEVMGWQALFNSVAVHIRLHYRNPVSGEWSYHDGLGAVGVQTDAGASAAELDKIKSDAIMKALPAAESYAVKDAAEKLGKLFGKDLNRKDVIAFRGAYAENGQTIELVSNEQLEDLSNGLNACSKDTVQLVYRAYGISDIAELPANKYQEFKDLISSYIDKAAEKEAK